MGCGEEYACNEHRGIFTANQAEQTVHHKILQKKLLINGPQHITRNVREIALVERMQRANFRRGENADSRKRDRRGQDPRRSDKPAPAQAEFVAARAPRQHQSQCQHQRHRRKNGLPVLWRPDDSDDDSVADDQFNKIAATAEVNAWHGL